MSDRKFQSKAIVMPDPIHTLLAHEQIDGLLIDLEVKETQFGEGAEMIIITSDGKEHKLTQRRSGGESYKQLFDLCKGKTLPLLVKTTVSRGWDGRAYEIKVPTAPQLAKWFKPTSDK